MQELTLITGNQGKAAEFSRLLGMAVQPEKIPLHEIQATDVHEVAKAKARTAYSVLQRPVFVDDTGLYINAWGQLPGALIAWFIDNIGNTGILKMLDGWESRDAKVVTALGYCDANGVRVFSGELKGKIAHSPRGENGFGYDEIFIPQGYNKTFAEMTAQEKDAISMRTLAAHEMRNWLALAI